MTVLEHSTQKLKLLDGETQIVSLLILRPTIK